MVSISRGAPAASSIRSVASMISGPMPSPWATVMGVFVDIRELPGYWNAPHRATTIRGYLLQPHPLEPRGAGFSLPTPGKPGTVIQFPAHFAGNLGDCTRVCPAANAPPFDRPT